MKIDELIGNLTPRGTDHPGLIAGGALFYVTLVAAMICTIVNLAHGEEWQVPTRLSTANGLRPIALDEAAAYAWTPVAPTAMCNAENWLDAGADPAKRRAVHKAQAGRNALANLVWAPPGTAIAYDSQASSQETDLALRATTSIASAGGSTLAVR